MSIDHKKYRILKLRNLNSVISLTRWLRRGEIEEDDDKVVPDNNILIYLSFIESQVMEQRVKDKREWLDAIEEIRDRVSTGEFS
jgi:hypothetical protein